MADWEWIEKFVMTVDGFGAADVSGFDDLPDGAPVRAAVQGMYAPHPYCEAYLDRRKQHWVLDHGTPIPPFLPATFLIAGVNVLGFLTGAMHISAPWTSEPGIIHAEHFDGPITLHRFDATLDDTFDAIRRDQDEFAAWYAQHRVTYQ